MEDGLARERKGMFTKDISCTGRIEWIEESKPKHYSLPLLLALRHSNKTIKQ
jgi:hypothetical protein